MVVLMMVVMVMMVAVVMAVVKTGPHLLKAHSTLQCHYHGGHYMWTFSDAGG